MLVLLAAVPAQARWQRECAAAVGEAQRAGVEVSALAVDVKSDRTLFSEGADLNLIPASNMKIATTAAAVLGFPADYRFMTDLIAHGTTEGELLRGSLRLRGEGDPTLESSFVVAAMVDKVWAAGIRRIDGDLLVDDRFFDDQGIGPAWPKGQDTRHYMAEVRALSLDEGTMTVSATPGPRPGERAQVTWTPDGSGVVCAGDVITGPSSEEGGVWVERDPGKADLRLGGRVGKPASARVAVPDPAMIFGNVLAHALSARGIQLSGQVRRPLENECPDGGRLIARLSTSPAEILPRLMKSSQNHRAECVFKHLGAYRGYGGTFAGGARAVQKIFATHGIEVESAVFADGSGLSRDDRVAARHLVNILKGVWKGPHRATFVAYFPRGGEKGTTLSRRYADLGDRLAAKTGTLAVAVGLSGYLDPDGDQPLAFSVLLNSKNGNRKSAMYAAQERLVRAFAGSR